ncbi:MAG: hypothetical protein GY925_03485 [Actinomycetia bacterium]|nr:hypothetical protein [Actinomycetes bacterium]
MSDYSFVIRAYPSDVRRELGDEIIETANLLAPQRWSLRQSASLLAGGLRQRAIASTGRSTKTTWAIGLRSALLFQFIAGTAGLIAFQLGARGDISSMSPPISEMIPASVAVIAVLAFTTRWPAAVALTAFSCWLVFATIDDSSFSAWGVTPPMVMALLIIGAAWWLAVFGDGRRTASPLATGLLLSGTVAVAYVTNDPDIVALRLGVPAALLVAGLALVSIDPRPSVVLGCIATFTLLPRLPIEIGIDKATAAQRLATSFIPVAIVCALLALGYRSTSLQNRTE